MHEGCEEFNPRRAMKMAFRAARDSGWDVRWGGPRWGGGHGPFGAHGPFGPDGPFGPGGPFGPPARAVRSGRRRNPVKIILAVLAALLVLLLVGGVAAYFWVNGTLVSIPGVLDDYSGRPADTPGTNWLLVGSDSPGLGLAAGPATHRELALLVAAGMTPSEALSAATQHNHRFLDPNADAGLVEVGWDADLLLVRGDPTNDITATTEIAAVWVDGRLVERTPRR